jgi:hypothetical protein
LRELGAPAVDMNRMMAWINVAAATWATHHLRRAMDGIESL